MVLYKHCKLRHTCICVCLFQLAEKHLVRDAKAQSEELHLEQAMLEDKIRETDWEVTQETIQEQVARESYLQWLRDNEKRLRTSEQVSNPASLVY